jgi:hypothetical protein
MNHYRLLSKVPPAYRPLRNMVVCRYFFLDLTLAIDAVDILASFTDGLSSLPLYPLAGATSMHLASDDIHPYKDAGGRPSGGRS